MYLEELEGNMVAFYCPGCGESHMVDTKKWSVNLETGTISPSVLVRGKRMPDNPERNPDGSYVTDSNGMIKGWYELRCHSFVKNGSIQYLSDCTHKLAGKTVPMEEI